jgi:hypothetical protein
MVTFMIVPGMMEATLIPAFDPELALAPAIIGQR